jgi:proline iminopeptidase
MQKLFPAIKPYRKQRLPVDEIHTLYVEESGSESGIPVLFVHGGPGVGCSPEDRCFFDPEKYRIILFDQRGAGRSTPHAELRNNTTNDLVTDIEKIRRHLSIQRWILFGGSWGSTLSLLYAQAHPERVIAMILRGIFLCRQQDLQWFYQYGASVIFPDYWQEYLQPIAFEKHENTIQAYYNLLNGDNELASMNAAKHWSLWEGRCATLRPNPNVVDTFSNPHLAMSLARIETHYFINGGFLSENQIIDQAQRLAGIPGMLVHGRYDMVCPLNNAMSLQQAWPDAELHIVRDAGHSSREVGIIDALVRATNQMVSQLESKNT